jgi:hypothetical protein
LLVDLPIQDLTYSDQQGFGIITPETESRLGPCSCGGRFRAAASPRCPSCHTPLSAIALGPQIEANAPGRKKGWRWQNDWKGLYAFVVDDHALTLDWRKATEA